MQSLDDLVGFEKNHFKRFLGTLLTLALGLACWEHFIDVTTPGSLLLVTGFGLALKDRCFKGPIKVIPILESPTVEDCLLLIFE